MNTATIENHKNPFPGLRPFTEDEQYIFFGRESQVDAMVDKMAATRFLAVVGTSGSGKSSLVNCGLRPALHGGLMARAGTAWRMAQFRPGSDPMRAMTRALAKDGVLFRDYQSGGMTLAEIVDTTLRMSKLGLIDIYEQAQLGEDVNLLVVVDQFEELFRYRQFGAGQQPNVHGISEEATAFVNLLLAAKEQTRYPIYVVLTMRSDFLGDCTQFTGLAEAINAGQYLVPRMIRDERRAAIVGPVGVGGAEISPVLQTRLVNDVGDNPDQLSILQHALNRTWNQWENSGASGPLDLPHYEAIGTMAHALDHHAERAYAELATAREQQICEKLFKALTDKATDPRGVRRPTTLDTLCDLTGATQTEVTQVIEVFRKPSRSFLMPPAGETLEPKTVIDISHESLMRVWERLKTWADEEAQSAQIYSRLAETAVLHGQGKAGLWNDPDLQVALDWQEKNQPNKEWARRYDPGFEKAMAFLQASEKKRADDEAERQRQQNIEIERARREREARNLRRWRAILTGMLVLGIIITAYAVRQKMVATGALIEATEQQRKAEENAETARKQATLAAYNESLAKDSEKKANEATAEAIKQSKLASQRLVEANAIKEKLNRFLAERERQIGEAVIEHPDLARKFNITTTNEVDRTPDRIVAPSTGDGFNGTSRKIAKLSIPSANIEVFSGLKDLIASLPSEETMNALGIGAGPTSDRVPEERRNVRVSGVIAAAAREDDNDFHLIVCGANEELRPCMTMEVSGLPPSSSEFFSRLKAVRDVFKKFFGNHLPGQTYDFYDPPIPVEIQGALYFDTAYSGGRVTPGPRSLKYRIPVIWEVHPITKIVFK